MPTSNVIGFSSSAHWSARHVAPSRDTMPHLTGLRSLSGHHPFRHQRERHHRTAEHRHQDERRPAGARHRLIAVSQHAERHGETGEAEDRGQHGGHVLARVVDAHAQEERRDGGQQHRVADARDDARGGLPTEDRRARDGRRAKPQERSRRALGYHRDGEGRRTAEQAPEDHRGEHDLEAATRTVVCAGDADRLYRRAVGRGARHGDGGAQQALQHCRLGATRGVDAQLDRALCGNPHERGGLTATYG